MFTTKFLCSIILKKIFLISFLIAVIGLLNLSNHNVSSLLLKQIDKVCCVDDLKIDDENETSKEEKESFKKHVDELFVFETAHSIYTNRNSFSVFPQKCNLHSHIQDIPETPPDA
jgi:hypothetical protein